MKYFEFKLENGDTAFMREDLVRRVTIHDGPDKYGVTGVVFYDGARQEFGITNTLPEIRKILGVGQDFEPETKETYAARIAALTSRVEALEKIAALKARVAELERAARGLRSHQKEYMLNRGNDEIGKAVAEAAKYLDEVLGRE